MLPRSSTPPGRLAPVRVAVRVAVRLLLGVPGPREQASAARDAEQTTGVARAAEHAAAGDARGKPAVARHGEGHGLER